MLKRENISSRWSLYQSIIILLLLAALVVSAIDRVNISISGTYWIKHHLMSASKFGLVQSIFSWSLTLFLLAAGPLLDRAHPRKILPIGMIVWTIATWLTAVTLRLPVLAIFRGLLGVGESVLPPSAPKVIVETLQPKDRSKAIAIFYSGNKIGPTIGLPLAAAMLVSFGWRSVFYVTGAFSLIWAILWLSIYRKDRRINTETSVNQTQTKLSWGHLFTYRNTWAMIIGQFGYLYVLYVFLAWLPGILVLQEHLSIGKSGTLSALPFVVSIVTTLLGGWGADVWVSKGVSLSLARKTIVGGGLLLSTVFVIIAAYSSSAGSTLFFLVLTMAAMGTVTGSVNSLPMDLAAPEVVSSVSSLQNFGGNLGASFAPLITGILYHATHSFRIPLVITGIVALIGAASYVLLLGKVEKTFQPHLVPSMTDTDVSVKH